VVNDITVSIVCLERDCLVWIILSIYAEFVPFIYQLVDHINVRPLRLCDVEASTPVVEHDGALALQGFALRLEVSKVYHMLVALL